MGQKISIEHQAGTRKGEKESFTSKVIRVGRDPSCEIRFDVEKDLDASATHAEIRWSGAGFKILDLGSTNGTYLNGEKVVEGVLSSGDEVRFGKDGPLIRISISRAHRPRAAALAIGAALILIAGTVALLLWLPRSEDSPSHVEAPRGVPEGEAIVAIYSRAWYATKSSVEVIAEAWGTGVLIREDGVVLAPKHVVRPWKFQPEARAMVEHYKSRIRTVVAVWVEGATLRSEDRVALANALTTENGKLEVFEAPDVFDPDEKEVRFQAGGKEVVGRVTLHLQGPHDAVLLRLKGGPYHALPIGESGGLPDEAVDLRIIGQRSSSGLPELLEPISADRRVLKRFERSFELEVGPRYWSGAVVLWRNRPVAIHSDYLGRCLPLDAVKEALLANPEIRQQFGDALRPADENG